MERFDAEKAKAELKARNERRKAIREQILKDQQGKRDEKALQREAAWRRKNGK